MKKLMASCFLALSALTIVSAIAQERREHERFRTEHWVYDDRYHHNHYYPVPGYALRALPPGHVAINFRDRHFFFHGGVWYQAGPAGYVVVRPPIGIAIPALPVGYSTVWVNGVPYYYANDVYYVQSPGGYAVAAPPEVATAGAPPPAPPPAVVSQAPPQTSPAPGPAPGMWYYCESAKAYYPYVSQCPEAWREVPAAPPR